MRVHHENDQITKNTIKKYKECRLKNSESDGNVDQDPINTLLRYEETKENELSL